MGRLQPVLSSVKVWHWPVGHIMDQLSNNGSIEPEVDGGMVHLP